MRRFSGWGDFKERGMRNEERVTPRTTIIDSACRWIYLMPKGCVFRAGVVREHVWGTQKIACLSRGLTSSRRFRYHADVSAALRDLVKEGLVRKLGGKWQRV